MKSKHTREWDNAIKEEIKQLILNRTQEEFILLRGANLVLTKQVFTIKLTVTSQIKRFKARLVTQGFSQIYSNDYTETFTPTVRINTLRLFLVIVAKQDLKYSYFNIKNTFTKSKLKEDIFLAPPEGVKVTPRKVLKALRSLYSLK